MIQGELCIYSCQDLQVKDPNSGVKTQAEIRKKKKTFIKFNAQVQKSTRATETQKASEEQGTMKARNTDAQTKYNNTSCNLLITRVNQGIANTWEEAFLKIIQTIT